MESEDFICRFSCEIVKEDRSLSVPVCHLSTQFGERELNTLACEGKEGDRFRCPMWRK